MIEANIIKLPTRLNLKFQDISKDNVLAKMAQETQTTVPSYEQNKAKIGEIRGTVNLGFKRPVHEGYMVAPNGAGPSVGGTENPAKAAASAYGAPTRNGCPQRPGTTGLGDGESCRGGGCLRNANG